MTDNETSKSPFANPWIQLIIGVICMACVANLQYGWTLFVNPIDARYHWGRASIQVAFTLFVLIETWLIPVEGYLVDRFGPRWVVMGGAFLVAIALVFDFLNGRNDAANSIATIVSTRVLAPRYAVAWAAFFNFIAFLVFGLHVASTVGRGIIAPGAISD